jgi:hypothetical protein
MRDFETDEQKRDKALAKAFLESLTEARGVDGDGSGRGSRYVIENRTQSRGVLGEVLFDVESFFPDSLKQKVVLGLVRVVVDDRDQHITATFTPMP